VKPGSANVGLIALKLFAGTSSASTFALNAFKVSRNAYGLPSKERAVDHGFSVLSFPALSTGTFGSILQSKLSTAVNVLTISSGGFLKAFRFLKSFKSTYSNGLTRLGSRSA
jgi:hypothetical protein